MKTTNKALCLSLIFCLVLIVAMALMTVGCTDSNPQETPATSAGTTATTEVGTDADDVTSAQTQADATPDITVKGEGDTVFYFNVIDKDGGVTGFEIHTNETKVGKALQALGLIEGEESQYGLFVKSVNGITADYNVDGTWWEFMVGDESSMTGVDLTDIEAGATYAFRVSK